MNEPLVLLAICTASALSGYLLGSMRGQQRGRDEQWIESYFESGAREKLRREKDGRFKSKTKS